jgi:hypothetical protein
MKKEKPIICLFVPIYKRLELVDYVFGYYNNLKKELSDLCELKLICVGSEGEKSKNIAIKHEFEYYEFPNNPLSEKFNYACMQCKKYNPNAVVSIGSDDIISSNIFIEYINLINENIDFLGFLDIFILTKNKLNYFEGYSKSSKRYLEPIGPGKFFSNKLINKLNWRPWDGKLINKNLDGLCNSNLNKLKYSKKIIKISDVQGFIIDIKTNFNITSAKSTIYKKKYDIEYVKSLGIDYDKIEHLLFEYDNIKYIKSQNKKEQNQNKDWWIKKRSW